MLGHESPGFMWLPIMLQRAPEKVFGTIAKFSLRGLHGKFATFQCFDFFLENYKFWRITQYHDFYHQEKVLL